MNLNERPGLGSICLLLSCLCMCIFGMGAEPEKGAGLQESMSYYEADELAKLLEQLRQPNLQRDVLEETLQKLRGYKVWETPSCWVNIFTDERFNLYHRNQCLRFFCDRHLKSGMLLDELGRIGEFRLWATSKQIGGTMVMGQIPIERRLEEPVFELALDQKPENLRVYLRTSGQIADAAFLAILRGEMINYGKLKITEIYVYDEHLKRSPRK